jgi:hypothetical protein
MPLGSGTADGTSHAKKLGRTTMRLIDVVLASVVLGAALGLITSGQPSAAASSPAVSASVASDGDRTLGERLMWLRTPPMRRTASAR